MALQQTQERLDRASEYDKEASFLRGVARSFVDIIDHTKSTFKPGSDPARRALEIVTTDLHDKRRRTIAEADRLTARAEKLREMVGAPDAED